jgi:hypothetical protein
MKGNGALNDFFKRDASWFVFGGIDVNAWTRAALELLAALGGNDDQAILGIDFGYVLFRCFVQLFLGSSHDGFLVCDPFRHFRSFCPEVCRAPAT